MSQDEPKIEEDASFGKEFKKERTATQILINNANVVDNADGQILPALYDPIKTSLGFGLEQLGTITMVRTLLQAVSTPIWGWFSDKFSRKIILAIGCFIWGIFTIIFGLISNYAGIILVRTLTGIGLAVITPTTQSLVADYFPESKRGKAFGYLGLTTVLGAIIGTLYATLLGDKMIMGMDGWRFVFISVGIISVILGILVWVFGKDPIRGRSELKYGELVNKKTEMKYTVKISDFWKIVSNKTFILIVLQGIAGSIPWNSILFIIFWLEEMGYDDFLAGIAFSVIAIGSAFGNLFGGILGDKAAKWNPKYGRIIVAQISVFSGIPMMLVIFLLLPTVATTTTLIFFILVGIVTGFMISWSAPAANNPIFSELFEPEIRSSAYSIDRLFEGGAAASGTYIVAVLAEKVFGYVSDPDFKGVWFNIDALAYAMLIATIIPWIVCLFFYSFVYITYPKDRAKMKLKLEEREKELQTKISDSEKHQKKTEELNDKS